MKKQLHQFKKLFGFFVGMGIALSSYAVQLSGGYTINPAAPATATNFKDFNSAIIYLTDVTTRPDGGPSNSAPFGISGPVKFTVSAGTYTGQVIVPDITGTSPINTLTFEGVNATTCIVRASILSQATFIIDQAKYVYVRNLTVENLGMNTVTGMAIIGSGSSNSGSGCRITGCIVNIPNTGSTSTSYGIIATATAFGASGSNNRIDSVWIDSNTVNGGYYGIYMYGNTGASPNYNKDNKIRYNTVNNVKFYGIYAYYHYNQFDVLYNTINMEPATTSQYGISFYYCQNRSSVPSRIIGNRVYNSAYMGIYIINSNNASGPATQVYNNVVAGKMMYTTNYGLYMPTTHRIDACHNTVNIAYGSAGGTKYGMYFSGSTTGNTFKNNIFTISATSGTTVYPAYFSTNPTGNVVNYNVYSNEAGANLLYRGGAYTAATYKTATAGGDTSYSYMPKYAGETDLSIASGCGARGIDLTATVPTDINGIVRSVSPMCGAYEYAAVTNDVAIDSYLYPSGTAVSGPTDLAVLVRNNGTATVTQFNVGYTLNGGVPVILPWSGTLNPCDTVRVIFTGSSQITLGASNKIKVFTDSPNGIADQQKTNDSVSTVSYEALAAGTYNVGPTQTFKTLSDAADALTYGGVTGPVTFIIDPGTYTGALNIIGPINGASATNTITFDGVDASTRTVTANISGAAILVNQASYVTIKNLTVTNSFAGAASGIALIGNRTNNAGVGFTVKNCVVNLPNVPNGTGSFGIVVTGNPLGLVDDNQRADSVTIDSNTINGGYTGIQISTNANGNASYNRDHKIRYNTINNAWYYGLRLYYIYNPADLSYNKITMNPGNQAGSYGLYVYYNQCGASTTGTRMIGNKIVSGYTGLYYAYAISTAAPSLIHNNMITLTGTGYGMYLYTSSAGGMKTEVYHNTIRLNNFSANYGLYYYNSNGPSNGSFIKNNIFSVVGSATYPVYFSTNPASGMVNYNNYYNAGGSRLGYRGAEFTTANYKTATTGGDSSFTSLMPFVNDYDLHAVNGCTPMGVDLTASVPLDFDGEVRSVTPNIGADQYNGVANDLAIEDLITPSQPAAAGLQDLVVRIKNLGSNIVTAFDISYKNNSGAVQTQPWFGVLNPCDTVSITFTGSQQINIGASNNIKIFTSAPNGVADGKPVNDTLQTLVLTPLNGNYTIGSTGSYPTFAAATTALYAGGVSGPVVFTVQPGTYNESVVVPNGISGVSSTNTIVFDGVNAATRIINDSVGKAVFTVDQTSYVTVKNFTITNTYPALCAGVALIGNTLNNAGVGFTLKNCVVNFPNVPNGTNCYGVIVTGNPSGTSETNQWTDSVTIDSNTVNGAYYGIVISTLSSTNMNANYNRNHKIRYNTVNSWYNGIRFYYIANPVEINYNTINMNPAYNSGYGIYMYYNQCGAAPASTQIIGNKVYAGYAGLYDYYATNTLPAYPAMIHNNTFTVFGPSAYVGMYVYTGAAGGAISQIYHNSVNILGAGTSYGMYYYNNSGSTSATMIKNNVFSVVGSATYPAYFSTNPAAGTINYNNYFNAGGPRLGYRGSEFTVANYKTATAGGDSSYNVDPLFISASNLHTNNACTKGVDLTAFVPVDIDGDIRSTTPVVGADETLGFANDITVDKVYINAPVTAGFQDISVRIKNMSPNTASTFNISYKLNGGATVTMPWSGTLLGCGDTAYVTFTGAQQANILSGYNSLKVYISDPNGVVDNNNTNDTVAMALSTITKVAGNMFVGNGTGGNGTGSAVRFDSKPSMIGTGTTTFSAEAWVKVGAYSDQKFVAKSSVQNGFAMGVDATGRFDAEVWTVANGTSSVRFTTQGTSYPTNIIPLNTWTHVAVTWESGVGVRAYINGSLVGFLNSATATTMSQSATDLFVGSNSWDGGHAVNGSVDEVRLWNVALDSVAIRRHMYSALTGTETGLTSYIQFNEPLSAATFSDPVSASTGYKGAATVLAASPIAFGSDSTLTQTGVVFGTFSSYDVNVNIYDAFDNTCDLTITEIPNAPNTLPAAVHQFTNKYWNIRAFGTPGSFLSEVTFSNFPIGFLNTTDAALGLYRRDNNSDGAWTLAKLSSSISPFSVSFINVDTFGQFTIASNGTSSLPVSLISFDAKAGDDVVNVNWATANEIGSSHFEVERAYAGSENFEVLGSVKAAGKTSKTVHYAWVDKTADLGQTIYYRLKQVDIDGRYKYSPVVAVEPQLGNDVLAVYPNPASNEGLNIAFASNKAEVAVITITDIAGKTVVVESVQAVVGQNRVKVPTSSMDSGVYFVSVFLNGTTQNIKLIKN